MAPGQGLLTSREEIPQSCARWWHPLPPAAGFMAREANEFAV